MLNTQIFNSIYADVPCGFRTVTWTLVDTTTSIASGVTVTLIGATSRVHSDAITLANAGGEYGYEDLTKIFTVTWHVDAAVDANKAGMNAATRTFDWSVRLIYKCSSVSTSPTAYITPSWTANTRWFDYYYDPAATTRALTLSDASGNPSHSLNSPCTINTYELRNVNCDPISTTALEYPLNFYQSAGTSNRTNVAFVMNINPADRLNTMTDPIIHEYQRCLFTENGHGVTNTRTFRLRLKCNSNYAVTLPAQMQAQ